MCKPGMPRPLTEESGKENGHDKNRSITAEGARSGSLRTGWSGGTHGDGKGACRSGSSTATEEIIRKWYKAWVEKDEGQFEALMTDNFTFTSAAGDDHISRSTFKTQCWDTQAKLI